MVWCLARDYLGVCRTSQRLDYSDTVVNMAWNRLCGYKCNVLGREESDYRGKLEVHRDVE